LENTNHLILSQLRDSAAVHQHGSKIGMVVLQIGLCMAHATKNSNSHVSRADTVVIASPYYQLSKRKERGKKQFQNVFEINAGLKWRQLFQMLEPRQIHVPKSEYITALTLRNRCISSFPATNDGRRLPMKRNSSSVALHRFAPLLACVCYPVKLSISSERVYFDLKLFHYDVLAKA
jgi:hypothetical protein